MPRHSSLSVSAECDSSQEIDLIRTTEDKARVVEDTNEDQFELDELLKDGMSGDKPYIHFPKLLLTNVISISSA